jgi:hypothetical protein
MDRFVISPGEGRPIALQQTEDVGARRSILSMLAKLPLQINRLVRIVSALQERIALIPWWLLISPHAHIPRELREPGLERVCLFEAPAFRSHDHSFHYSLGCNAGCHRPHEHRLVLRIRCRL